NRSDFYEKELTFQVSCSYGPGRYDPNYETRGLDYPIGFVRWTEQRNFEAVLELLASGSLAIDRIISERVNFSALAESYDQLLNNSSSLGIVIEYDHALQPPRSEAALASVAVPGQASLGFIGAGAFAKAVLIPAFLEAGASIKSAATRGGKSLAAIKSRYPKIYTTSNYNELLSDPEIAGVVIATRHDTHSLLAAKALAAGKHVFVEKPLALNLQELLELREVRIRNPQKLLMVGFNRRFAPLVLELKRSLSDRIKPLTIVATINAGSLPKESWISDPSEGGGRVLGEVCHFVDLVCFLCGAPIASVFAAHLGDTDATARDSVTAMIKFQDGSMAAINYVTSGHRSYPKERFDLFWDGKAATLDNFRRLKGFGFSTTKFRGLLGQDKGHKAESRAFVAALKQGGATPISWEDIFQSTLGTLAIVSSLESGREIELSAMLGAGNTPSEIAV
ncbi:MAG: dehydrogenase, partial [Proteobacteria bacterium]